jgi:5'-methylthioadenosine phosphorylase
MLSHPHFGLQTARTLATLTDMSATIGLIGGTGLGEALLAGGTSGDGTAGPSALTAAGARMEWREVDTPWGRPSGPIQLVEWKGVRLAILARHGPGHALNPSQVPYRANIYALKSLGATHIIAGGAVGSLREDIAPRDLVIVDQVIDRTFRRTPTFFDEGLAVHVEFAQPCCPQMRGLLLRAAERVDVKVHRAGTYVCMEGPAFSTQAESNMHRLWGGDLIGMTMMPEAKLAREAEISYGLIALATDYDCWRPHAPGITPQALLREIIGHLKVATANAISLMRAAIEEIAREPLPMCGTHTCLDLAVWTSPDRITPEVYARYGILLDRWRKAHAGAAK